MASFFLVSLVVLTTDTACSSYSLVILPHCRPLQTSPALQHLSLLRFSLTHNPSFSAFLCWKKCVSSCFISTVRDLGYCAWDPAEAKVFKGELGEFGMDRASVTISRWSGYVPCLGKSQCLWLPGAKNV